ncbi:MAG: ribonuclease H-like domain-containing protein [Chloroflexia bacterium]
MLPGLPEGSWVETGTGLCYVAIRRYPPDHRHGSFPLKAFLEEPPDRWTPIETREALGPLRPEALFFLDIETTGLAGGAGTYAFLVGIGQFEDEKAFCIRQVFLPSPAQEAALLDTVAALLEPAEGLITFNGQGFDLPLLGTRYAMARRACPWDGKAHLDLLPVARRLWRARLPSCSLASLEEHLLGIDRDPMDISGYQIPSLYYAYLHQRDADILTPVFYHNAQDILSMVTLAVQIARLLRDPWSRRGPRHGPDFYALARLYEARGNVEQAVSAYRSALLFALPPEERERAWQRLSMLLKRLGAWEEAAEIWESLLERPGPHPLYAYVELARYYEHRRRDPERAAAIVQRAIAEYGECPREDSLAHRLARLRRKMRQEGIPRAPDAGARCAHGAAENGSRAADDFQTDRNGGTR